MNKIIVTLTKDGQEAYRSNQISRLGSDKALTGSNSLLRMKAGIQNKTVPRTFETVETSKFYLGKGGTMKQRVAAALGFRTKNADKFISMIVVL